MTERHDDLLRSIEADRKDPDLVNLLVEIVSLTMDRMNDPAADIAPEDTFIYGQIAGIATRSQKVMDELVKREKRND